MRDPVLVVSGLDRCQEGIFVWGRGAWLEARYPAITFDDPVMTFSMATCVLYSLPMITGSRILRCPAASGPADENELPPLTEI